MSASVVHFSTDMASILASDHNLRLSGVNDALDVISSGLRGCIFTTDDLSADFFDLRNGIAGEVFQKFVNYSYRVAFVVPDGHGLGDRVTELAKEHTRHPIIRFFTSIEDAQGWLG